MKVKTSSTDASPFLKLLTILHNLGAAILFASASATDLLSTPDIQHAMALSSGRKKTDVLHNVYEFAERYDHYFDENRGGTEIYSNRHGAHCIDKQPHFSTAQQISMIEDKTGRSFIER